MAKLNIKQFQRDIAKAAPKYKGLMYGAALSRFNSAKNKMVDELFEDGVTKEIEAGPEAEPSSGVVSKGNLFSFIGFEEGADPITPIVNILENQTLLNSTPKITSHDNYLLFSYSVKTPTKKELSAATPLPFLKGRSWLYGIENGISGIGNYLFHRYFPRSKSRSTTGLQKKNATSIGSFTPRPYITPILDRFKKRIEEGTDTA